MTGSATTPARASVVKTQPARCSDTIPSARAREDTTPMRANAAPKLI